MCPKLNNSGRNLVTTSCCSFTEEKNITQKTTPELLRTRHVTFHHSWVYKLPFPRLYFPLPHTTFLPHHSKNRIKADDVSRVLLPSILKPAGILRMCLYPRLVPGISYRLYSTTSSKIQSFCLQCPTGSPLNLEWQYNMVECRESAKEKRFWIPNLKKSWRQLMCRESVHINTFLALQASSQTLFISFAFSLK